MQELNYAECSNITIQHKKEELFKLKQVNFWQFFVLDFIVLVACLVLAVILLRQKEKHSFEFTTVGCMSLSFFIWVCFHFDDQFNDG